MANLLTGKEVATYINENSKEIVDSLKEKGIFPTLAVVRVGEKEDDLSYERGLSKRCQEIGVLVKTIVFPLDVSKEKFYQTLGELNKDETIHGILVFRPIPKELDNDKVRNFIAVEKDVDGCTDLSLAGVFTNQEVGFAPCTAEAAIKMLDYYKIDVTGKKVVVLGRSLVVGRPVSMLLLHKNATVTICHTKTKNVKEITKEADIVICATGQMESLDKEYFSEGQTIIDVGVSFNEVKQKLCGDVLFEEVEPIVENITPVPRGVGSVTTSVLVNHVVVAAQRKMEGKK